MELVTREAYCPTCKTTHEFIKSARGLSLWDCRRTLTTFSGAALERAFLDISKDINYKKEAIGIENFSPKAEGGVKFDSDKPRMELLDTYALEQIALVMSFGAKKYAAHNWRGGLAWSRLIGAALRHILAFMKGEDKDPESGLSHIAHAGCCIMFLLWHEKHKVEKDDRYKA